MKIPVIFGIYTARFSFIDSSSYKIRPVIVISSPRGRYNTMSVIPISSKPKSVVVDKVLEAWKEAGLVVPSVARIHRLSTVLSSSLVAQLGVVSTLDQGKICQALKTHLSL